MQAIADSSLNQAFLKADPQNVRNVCIVAHVDHGKTTLADSLVSSNGHISARFVGKLRYMDSREDEQTRGITMKSSAVSLYYEPFLINLIDSPGHVDFGSEVNSAVNLADVALVVVDVVHGVCSQTESLLRQAVASRLDMVLVLNKLDRLATELKMTEAEAYRHIQHVIGHMNSSLSQIIVGAFLENDQDDLSKMEATEARLHFDPAKGNVIFGSAVHGFAFSLDDFATLYAVKLKLEDKKELTSCLFGDYYLAGGKIRPDAEAKGKATLFEQLVLKPIWEVHKVGMVDKDIDRLKELAAKLGITGVTSKRLDEAFEEFMRNWMNLAKTVLKTCLRCNSPKDAFANPERAAIITGSEDHPLIKPVQACDANSDMVVVYVAKLLKCDAKKIAMCRVMSGTLKRGTSLFLAGASESDPLTVNSLFAMIGREVVPIEAAPAGTVCAFELTEWLTGTTFCSTPTSTPLAFASTTLEPLVRVTIQSLGTGDDWDELRDALKQLAILDQAVRVIEQENGDLALITAGEVHLQKCLQDLEDMGIQNIHVSEPIVPFVETIIPESYSSYAKILTVQLTECFMKSAGLRLKLRAVPLHNDVVEYLQKNDAIMKAIRERSATEKQLTQFRDGIVSVAKECLPGWKGSFWMRKSEADIAELVDRIWSFGPIRAKYNVLFNGIADYDRPSVWETKPGVKRYYPLDRAIVAGFDIAMTAGPLCQEPIQGVAIIVEEWKLEAPVIEKPFARILDSDSDNSDAEPTEDEPIPEPVTPLEAPSLTDFNDPHVHGQLISAMKATCKAALDKHPRRLVAAMYKCKVQTSSQALGKVHTVLAQRHAKVLNEDLNQMSGLFEIEAHMPIVESFSFCEQLRKKTSGMAAAQMEFSHWQLLEDDPFWEPTTEDEIEEFGVKGDSVNQARQYVDMVKKRKGIFDELIVVSAEKQRNLKRNK
uniref:Tr-type G domain-containing protein n=1 Tax=Panagrellus redivivus TaxID=6233 RepID=A0A7E4UQ11_PANRE